MIDDDSKMVTDQAATSRPSGEGRSLPGTAPVLTARPDSSRQHLTRQRLIEVLAQLPPEPHWQIDHLAAQHLRLQGDRHACRLQLQLTVYLHAEASGRYAQIDLRLLSESWVPTRPLPSLLRGGELPPPLGNDPATALVYSLEQAAPAAQAHPGAGAWLRYLGKAAPATAASDTPLSQQVEAAFGRWLSETAAMATVAGAEAAAFTGPLGHFGPLEAQVLERSAQMDLAVDATLLATADDAIETGGEPGTTLALYGERFGVWLLHRRTAKLVKPARKGVPALRQWSSEVLQAESANALIGQAGLGEVEKRLFRDAGILPNATLWSALRAAPADKNDEGKDGAAGVSTALDLSAVPDRERRYLQAIVALAQQGPLDATDLDLLHRTARQLARAKLRRR